MNPDIRYLLIARGASDSGEGRDLRLRHHLTQAEMGGECGVSGPAIARWEAGVRVPRGDAALRYGKLLKRLRRLVADESAIKEPA